jgi:tape measure domain-containing protein
MIAFGYEIDKNTEKKVNDSIKSLEATASKLLGKNEIGFEVDKASKEKAEAIMKDLGDGISFEIDEASKKIIFDTIDDIKEAAELLEENGVGFDVDLNSKSIVLDSVDDLTRAAEALQSNEVAFQVNRQSEQDAKRSIRSIHSMATRLLGLIGIGFSFVQMGRLADEFGGINDMIRDATRGLGDQAEIQQIIKRAANDARQDYSVMANTVSRLAQNRDVFYNIEDAAHFATLMARDFAAAGKSQEKAAYLTRYMAMDLQKGQISSRTITTMFRDAPHMANRLAESLGVSTGTLQEMARRGEISADVLRNSFLDSADDINARFGEIDLTIGDALRNIRNGWGLFVADMDSAMGISRALARAMVNGFNSVMFTLRRLMDWFLRLADRLGGISNLMRLLAISAGAIFLALNAKKILGFLSNVSRGLTMINLKTLALAAIFVLIALLIDDFIAFMRGDSSLFGAILEKFGVDADAVRELINGLLETVRGMLPFLLDLGRQFGGVLVNALQLLLPLLMDLIRRIMPPIMDFIRQLIPVLVEVGERLIPLIVRVAETLVSVLFTIIEAILPVIIGLLERLLPFIFQIIEQLLPVIIGLIETLLPLIFTIIEAVLPVIISLIEMALPLLMQIVEMILPVILDLIDMLLPLILTIVEMVLPLILSLIEAILPILMPIIELVMSLVSVILPPLISFLQAVLSILEPILSLLRPIFEILGGIVGFIGNVVGGIGSFIGGLFGGGGNPPGYESGGGPTPDTFIAGEDGPELITGARNRHVFDAGETEDIFNAMRDVTTIQSPGYQREMVLEAANTYSSYVENRNTTINVEVNQDNDFHGERDVQVQSYEAMDRAADDTTDVLERALTFIR